MSDESKSTASSAGTGLSGLVFLLFLGLKLAGVAPVSEWSWWWVTAPLWGVACLVMAIMLIALPFVYISAVRKDKRKREWRESRARRGFG